VLRLPAISTTEEGCAMAVESTGHERGNPRFFALIENSPKTGKSPTVWAWPQLTEYLKVAGQPVQGPWPPDQEARPDPDADSMPVAVRDEKNPQK
jgi:hypothetical protein